MKLRRSIVSKAVGAALAAAVLAPATVLGVSYDIDDGEVYTESRGDALIFPIYTTVNGATTSFSVTNDDDDNANVVKIRFREQEHSMDVLDFIAVLSPNDKFDFWVSQGPNDERPVMSWNDNTCVVGPDGNSVMFPAPNTPFVTTNEQMQVGHVEVLGTFDLNHACYDPGEDRAYWNYNGGCETGDIDLGDAATHDASGEPADCATLVKVLSDPDLVYDLRDDEWDGVGHDLLGRYVITAGADGVEAGGDALELRNTDLLLYAQSQAPCDGDSYPDCVSYYAWDKSEWDHPHLGELDDDSGDFGWLQELTGAGDVAGDWSNNPANAVGVDWVLTFFTKYVFLDYVAKNQCNDEGSAKAWCLLHEPRNPELHDVHESWTEASTTDICLKDNSIDVWDTEEAKATGNVNVSPGTRETLDLCNEVNVFTFAADEGAAPRDSLIQTNDRRLVLGFKNLDAVRGWAQMELNWYDGWDSLAGLIFTTRATDDPNHNNGSITEIKKTWAWED